MTAPEFPLKASWLNSDEPLTLAALKGRVVLLDFWTYCCINCMHVLPVLEKLEQAFAGQPFEVIGIHSAKFDQEKNSDNIRRAMARHGVRHPVLVDNDHSLWQQYAVRSWPTLVLIDAEGKIAETIPGEADFETLQQKITALLAHEEKRGVLKKTANLTRVIPAPASGSFLNFPGKVRFFEQDDKGVPDLLVVSDTGHHQLHFLELTFDKLGWPHVKSKLTVGSGGVGQADGSHREASFRRPQGIDRQGQKFFVCDTENYLLREIDLEERSVTTLAGNGAIHLSKATGESALETPLRSPWDCLVVEDYVFMAMAGAHQIWIYDLRDKKAGPVVGTGFEQHIDGPFDACALAQPSSLAHMGKFLLIADSETSSIRLADMENLTVLTVMGKGLFDFGDVDGTLDEALLQHPLGAVYHDNHIFVADTFNNKIRRIDLEGGTCSTFLGDGSREILAEPGGLEVFDGLLYIPDTNNHRIVVARIETGEMKTLDLNGA